MMVSEGLKGKGIHINATEIMIYSPDVVGCLVEIIWASRAFNIMFLSNNIIMTAAAAAAVCVIIIIMIKLPVYYHSSLCGT